MSKLKHIPSKTIKTILNEYSRDDYRDCENELAQVLWEREDKAQDALINNRCKEIERELKRFKMESRAFGERLKKDGDSLALRQDIINCINEFKVFNEFCL